MGFHDSFGFGQFKLQTKRALLIRQQIVNIIKGQPIGSGVYLLLGTRRGDGMLGIHPVFSGICKQMSGPAAFTAIGLGLVLQSLLFQFGGLTALGGNALLMGLPALACGLLFRLGRRRSPRLQVMLAQGISSGERMDYTLQKAVELGVTAIQPIAAKRSVVKLAGERIERRVAHWQGVVASACEQCGRNQVPGVAPPLPLANWLGTSRSGRLLFLSPLAEARLADLPAPDGTDCLVAGPEGGFEADEIAALHAAGAIPVRLGPRVLRTETAALAALAAMQTLWGDF